ncbi:MAG TPA: response regulator [Allosphingosinicella sp.]|nr:response regulator [Allosphingosinicella sp.]
MLVVDDDERNLLAIGEVLGDLAEVVTAASGEEALRLLLKDDEFAVILLDVYMPGIDGYETAQIIRGREQTKRIPIVFLSAVNKETEHLMRGYVMGAVDYVFKPVEAVVLRSKVSVFVDLYEKTQEIERKAAAEQALLDANLRANEELLAAEKELRLAQQRQAAIIASVPIVLYLEPVEREPRWPSYISGNFDEITGYSYGFIEQHPNLWEERLHEEDRPRVLQALAARQETGRHSVEYRWQCADGSYKHFHDQAVLIRDPEGAPLHFAGTLLDVTDRKELESQLLHSRKMDAVGKLTGGIAHDFNNLLAAMLGGVGLIERRIPLDDSQKKIVSMMRHAAEQGSELVGRLLAFARRQQLQPGRIDLQRLSTSVTELLAHTLGGLVRLEWRVEEGIWPVYADATQLELALMNLIINARDAMPDGGTIRVCAQGRSVGRDNSLGLAPGDYVTLAVEDDGSGIPPELLERVTEPFFTTKEVGKGTGLGLSMVYGFARQSGGSLAITSEQGQGTSVELWLPRAVSEREADAPEEAAAGLGDQRALRILLVDDNEAVRATTAALLADLGHSVETAEDGASMLKMLDEDSSYDLIITDYAMPLMSGGEAMLQARAVKPDIRAIIISGYADAEDIERKPEGVQVLGKPFSPDDMTRAIARAVE